MSERIHPSVQRMPYWARKIYAHTTALGRSNLETIYRVDPMNPQPFGRGGYKLCPAGQPQVQLTGVHRQLRSFAWASDEASGKKRAHNSSAMRGVKFEDGRATGGVDRGRLVHLEIQQFVNQSPEQFRSNHPKVDPLTNAVLAKLVELELSYFQSELLVYDIHTLSGTAVDLVCLNREGGVVLIEVKTGYTSTNFCEVDPEKTLFMRRPFSTIHDTEQNRAFMQLLLTGVLFERTFGIRPDNLIVLHATPDTEQAIVHFMPREIQVHRGDLSSAIINLRIQRNVLSAKKKLQRKSVNASTARATKSVPIGSKRFPSGAPILLHFH